MSKARVSKYVPLTIAAFPVTYAYRPGKGFTFDKLQLSFGVIYDGAATLNAIVGCRVWIVTGGKGPGTDDGLVVVPWITSGNPPDFVLTCNQQLDIPFGGDFYLVLQFNIATYYALSGTAALEFTLNSH